MKVLVQNLGDVSRGISNVLRACGHNVTEWDSLTKPAFDAFDETEPHIFLGHSKSRAIAKCIGERKTIRTALLQTIPAAADVVGASRGRYDHRYATQVACVNGASTMGYDLYFAPIIARGLRVKICGPTPLPTPEYLGPIDPQTSADLVASAAVSLALDPVDEFYRILASGGFPLSIHPLPAQFADCGLPTECHPDIVHDWVVDRTARRIARDKAWAVVMQYHTYWHRVADLFRDRWDMQDEADRIMGLYREQSKEIGLPDVPPGD